ncbi:MAG: HPF/RaiA family ribosome-associated protein [Rhizomicrobium sp.]|nr:HPF/RaiA family ribosome-associated protein [Rhizomicrobium sp.]
MLIQVNTDTNIEGSEKFVHYVEAELNRLLSRFRDGLSRLEIHLSDENGGKPGANDKRCILEARRSSHSALVVRHDGATLQEAWTGAAKKLVHALESDLGRDTDHKGRASIRTEEATASVILL